MHLCETRALGLDSAGLWAVNESVGGVEEQC